jgi:hypothetical protein
MRFFKKKSWAKKMTDRLHRGGPAVMITCGAAKFLAGLGIGVLLATYFPEAPKDGWEMWGWTLILFALVVSIPALRAAFNNK